MTHAERILALLAKFPDLDDDEISRLARISPRQTVNQECRRLAGQERLIRFNGPRGKIVNRLVEPKTASFRPALPPTVKRTAEHYVRLVPQRIPVPMVTTAWQVDPACTLMLISCSGDKAPSPGVVANGPSILGDLPEDLAARLRGARAAIRDRASVDEATLIAAWRRYNGILYDAAGGALAQAVAEGLHLIIVSGGYGLLRTEEPIGLYDAVFHPGWWPHGLLEAVLLAYLRKYRLRHVRAFMSRTTGYQRLVRRVRWREAGVSDAMLLCPVLGSREGATGKSPRVQGAAFAAFVEGRLQTDWQSSAGIRLSATCL